MAPPSPTKPQTLKAGPPAQAPASCSANLLRSHRREGGRVPTDAAPGWKPRLRGAGYAERSTHCPGAGRHGAASIPAPAAQGTEALALCRPGRGTRNKTWAECRRRERHPCSPPSSAPPQARLTAEAPSPRPRPSPSPCPRPTAPAAQRGVGPAGRCAPPSCASAAGLWLGTSPSWRRRKSADTAPPGRDAQHRAAPRGAADPEAHGRRTPRPERGRPTGTCGHGSEQ